MTRSTLVGGSIACLVLVGAIAAAGAQDLAYKLPPQVVIDILDAAPPPTLVLSPSRDRVLVVHRRSMPPIGELAQPMLRLAGQRVNPRTSGPHRAPDGARLVLKRVADGQEIPVSTPAEAPLQVLDFSPDGKFLAFAATRADRIELWLADSMSGRADAVAGLALNGSLVDDVCEWTHDGRGLLCAAVPATRGPAPVNPPAPTGPNVQETSGKPAPVATYQDLLTSAHGDALFEHYGSTQLVFVDAAARRVSPLGSPGLLAGARLSPNGEFVLVERIKRPFSRLVPSNAFPRDFEVWRRDGTLVRTVASLPLADAVPMNGVPTGPRGVRWNAVAPATLVWMDALDGGDPKAKVPHRDRILSLAAPFSGEPAEMMRTEYRAGSHGVDREGPRMITENDRARRWTRTWLIADGQAPRMLFDRSSEDEYKNPGMPLRRPGSNTILQAGTAIYLTGQGASPEGDRPFLDRLDLTSLQTTRLFRSEANTYEMVTGLLSDDASRVITRFETPTNSAQLLRAHAAGDVADGAHGLQGPGASAAGRHQATAHLQARGRCGAVGHALPPARLHAWHPPADVRLGLSPRVHGSWCRKPGHRRAGALHDAQRRLPTPPAHAGLRDPRRAHHAHRRRWRDRERQLRGSVGRERQSGRRHGCRDGRGRSGPHRRRRAQLRRVHDGQPAGPFRSVPCRDRAQRGVQPDADAVRFPERATDLLGSAGRVCADVPVLVCAKGERADPADTRRSRQQLGHVPDPVRAVLHGAQGTWGHRALRHAAARGPRLRRAGICAAYRGRDDRVAGQVREERGAPGTSGSGLYF